MKYDQFKKQVLIETGVFSVLIIIIGVVVYLLSTIRDDYVDSNTATQKKIDATDKDMAVLKAKYSNILQNMPMYEEVKNKAASGLLTINRKTILEKFNLLKNQYALANLRLSAPVPQDVKDAQLNRKNITVNFSEVTADFEILNDTTVYEFLTTMPHELPGISKLTHLSMSIEKPVNEEVLVAISQRGTYPLIKTNVKFIWFGLNAVETANPNAPKTP